MKSFHLLAELGVIVLLFEIGLETDLLKLLQVGGAATVVAVIGVVVPFAMGYVVVPTAGIGRHDRNRRRCKPYRYQCGDYRTSPIGLGASSGSGKPSHPRRCRSRRSHRTGDSGRCCRPDPGTGVTVLGVCKTTGIAFGFVVSVLLLGSQLIPPLLRLLTRNGITTAALTMLAIMLPLGMAWLAFAAGSATIIGAFAAGLLLGRTPQAHDIRHGVVHLGHFFVPIFFVMVGTAVDVRLLNPFNSANHQVLVLTGLLVLVAVIGKFLAGYGPFWLPCKKSVIGVGMIPRGEVGLIFAQMGLSTGVFDAGVFSAVTLMVMATTFMAPPLLKYLLSRVPGGKKPPELPEIQELVTEA